MKKTNLMKWDDLIRNTKKTTPFCDKDGNVIWGTDNVANNYNIDYARYWANLDRGIIGEIAQNAESFRCPGCPERKFNSLWEAVSENNFQRFFGKQEGGAA